jgi:hypothetical protein
MMMAKIEYVWLKVCSVLYSYSQVLFLASPFIIQQHAGVLKYKIEGTFINFKWNSKFYLSTSWSAMNASKVTIRKKMIYKSRSRSHLKNKSTDGCSILF